MGKIVHYFMICLATALVGWGCSSQKETPPEPTPPTPPTPPVTTYDIDIAATHSLGVYYEVEDGLISYFLTLADIEIGGTADVPVPSGAGNLLVLDIFTKSKEEGVLPAGTYNYTSGDPQELKFTSTSKHLRTGVDNPVEEMNFFTEATMTVVKEGDIYTIEVIGKVGDEAKQRTLHTTYKGKLKFDPYTGEGGDDIFPRLEKSIETTFITPQVAYFGKNEKDGYRFEIILKDYVSSSDYLEVGRILRLHLFTATADNKMPAPGTYTVAAKYDNFSTYGPGEIQPGYIDNVALQNKGTHLIDTRIDGGRLRDFYGVVSKGTVVISQDGDQTTFTINFTDENKNSIKGSYTGKISVRDRSYLSTLTNDHRIQLANMPCEITYHGKLYSEKGIDADSWVVQITSGENGSDALQLELLAPSSEFANGLPAGTYNLSDFYSTGEYAAIPGRKGTESLLCSWYLGDMVGNTAGVIAPLKTGSVTVTRSGTECSITIDALDDAPNAHKVTGNWTGTPKYTNALKQPKAAAIPTFRTAFQGK